MSFSYKPAAFQRNGRYRPINITAVKDGLKLRVYPRKDITPRRLDLLTARLALISSIPFSQAEEIVRCAHVSLRSPAITCPHGQH